MCARGVLGLFCLWKENGGKMEPGGRVGLWWQFTAHSHMHAGLPLQHL